MSSRVSFLEALAASFNTDYPVEWARLNKVNLPTSPIERLIDKATGHEREVAEAYIKDFRELVRDRLPSEARGVDELRQVEGTKE